MLKHIFKEYKIFIQFIIFIACVLSGNALVEARRVREGQLGDAQRLIIAGVHKYGLLPVRELEKLGLPVFWASVDYNAYRSVTGLILNPEIVGHRSEGRYLIIIGEYGDRKRLTFERGIDVEKNSILGKFYQSAPKDVNFDNWLRKQFQDHKQGLLRILQEAYLEEILLSDSFSFLNVVQMRPGVIVYGREIRDAQKVRNSILWIAPSELLIHNIITHIGSPHGEVHVAKVESEKIGYILAPKDIYPTVMSIWGADPRVKIIAVDWNDNELPYLKELKKILLETPDILWGHIMRLPVSSSESAR